MALKYIAKKDVRSWLDYLTESSLVMAPVREMDCVVYRPLNSGCELELDERAVCSPKEAVFPQTELLFTYVRRKNSGNPGHEKVEMTENVPDRPAVLFGSRPCGTRGITMIDKVYDCGQIRDSYYVARRENTALVTIACTRPESTCFCHSVGSGPADPEGSDILLIPVDGGYQAEAFTEQGTRLMEFECFVDAGSRRDEAGRVVEKSRQILGEVEDYSHVGESVYKLFDDMDFWEELSAKCLNCGACAYLCPTCHCFNITDQTVGLSGRRIRTWDNCMSFEFTLEGSGHNPRPTKAHRMRNRLGHKFAYYPENNNGLIACCGCGRCIERCPSGVDIRAMVLAAMERANV